MKRKTKAGHKRMRKERESDERRHRRRGYIGETDMVPVYRRDMQPLEAERFGSKAVYFEDYCITQIGVPWPQARDMMLESDCNLSELETYGETLAQEFRTWAFGQGLQPRGVKLW